jgi:enoyl-CoA hydratase/carnithine racemase
MSSVTYRSENAVGTITLDIPPANSYDLAVMTEFSANVDRAIDDAVRAVIVGSASEKFFSAGADIKRFHEGDVDANMEMIRTSQAAFRRMASASAVFIAHINGHALGGGLEIALACDLRYANTGTYKLGTPEVTLGLLPGNGGTQRMTRLIGPARAMDLLITGRTVSPEEALRIGLVSELFAPEEGAERVQSVAQQFASGPALAIAAIKRCVHEGGQLSLVDGLALEASEMEQLFRSRDAAEGLAAFVEKRKPEFVGA